ncbi:MAG: hypothetical protein ACYSU3_06910 [Planctomycetota bacterium]|jgi:Na+-translocating ferredoxin:NAD+ oxidoreductase RnfD subunit
MGGTKKATGVFKKQPIMRRVLVALLPCIASGIYFFGWRSLVIVPVNGANL